MLPSLSLYGLIISLAIYICLLLAEKRTKKDNKQVDKFWSVAFVALISGIIGARLYHVLDFWNYYLQAPIKILYVQQGGLGIWGGIIGATIGIVIYAKKQGTTILYWLDLFASVAPLGQAIGRLGNFFNQELFGFPTRLPWGVYVSSQNRPYEYKDFDRFHPLFLYESILNLALFFILTKISKKYALGSGKIIAGYLMGYSIIRFWLEFLKIEPWKIGGVNVAQAICVSLIVLTTLFLYTRRANK